jgi:hypothetical protein
LNNPNYIAADVFGTLEITSNQGAITLANLSQDYDGTQKVASVTTTPQISLIPLLIADLLLHRQMQALIQSSLPSLIPILKVL